MSKLGFTKKVLAAAALMLAMTAIAQAQATRTWVSGVGDIVNDSLSGSPNTVIVTLRNLSINGASTGTNGIRFISGKALHVEDCQINRFNAGVGRGISVELSTNSSQIITIKDTFIKE